MNILLRKLSSLHFRLLYKKAQLRDLIRGVDFTNPMTREAAGIDNIAGTEYYGSTEFAPELNSALKYLAIKSDDCILDYGSGKGAALLKFREYPFRKICGVELSTTLAEISISNFKKLGLTGIEVVNTDATEYVLLDDYNYFYFANPFSGTILDKVLQNVIHSVEKKPRQVGLIYYHPKCHHQVMNTGRFKVVKEFKRGARKIIIYRNS